MDGRIFFFSNFELINRFEKGRKKTLFEEVEDQGENNPITDQFSASNDVFHKTCLRDFVSEYLFNDVLSFGQ